MRFESPYNYDPPQTVVLFSLSVGVCDRLSTRPPRRDPRGIADGNALTASYQLSDHLPGGGSFRAALQIMRPGEVKLASGDFGTAGPHRLGHACGMADRHQLRCYEYVNRPYAQVQEALRSRAPEIFQRATTTAATRATSLGAELHAKLGALELGRFIAIDVTSVEDTTAYGQPALRVHLKWSAAERPGMFPTMTATLTAFPLSSTETQLELDGAYDPPFGALGQVIDSVLLHRIAEASVLRFVQDVASFLRGDLP